MNKPLFLSTKSFAGTRRSESWFGFEFWFVSPERVERQRSLPTSRHRDVTDRRYSSIASLERQRNGKKIIFFKVIIIFLKTLYCKCGNIIVNLWIIEIIGSNFRRSKLTLSSVLEFWIICWTEDSIFLSFVKNSLDLLWSSESRPSNTHSNHLLFFSYSGFYCRNGRRYLRSLMGKCSTAQIAIARHTG